jgi:NAD(P)H-hydrate epimerase
VLARHLDLRGYPVQVGYWNDPAEFSPDCRSNFEILARSDVPLVRLPAHDGAAWQDFFSRADWLVDALLGTGAQGTPRPPYAAVIDRINAHGGRRLAVDWPSGLDCDSGQASAATVRADHTICFVAAKLGAQAATALPFLGRLHIVDIGVPRKLIEQIRRQAPGDRPQTGKR